MLLATIPTELLYEIIAEILSSYIDPVITKPINFFVPLPKEGTLASLLPHRRFPSGGEDSAGDYESNHTSDTVSDAIDGSYHGADGFEDDSSDWGDTGSEASSSDDSAELDETGTTVRKLAEWDEQESNYPLPDNPVVPLLSVSRKIRAITLKVICDALGTDIGNSAIGR